MTYSAYQHWDPLRVCVVGRSYPPEFYSWIEIPHVRKLFERIAIETEEDYQSIIKKLESFGVNVLRPNINLESILELKNYTGQFKPPPMTPRDQMVMVGTRFYENATFNFENFYRNIKDPSWPECKTFEEFKFLPNYIQEEAYNLHQLSTEILKSNQHEYYEIFNYISDQGNQIFSNVCPDISGAINGAMISRIGRDLYFGTNNYAQNIDDLKQNVNKIFRDTRNHIVNTGGHSDATYCPVTPGLIISLNDVPTYKETFPDWEVIYLPGQSWGMISPFLKLKKKNRGRWWIPGFENDQSVIDTVETWLDNWVGYVEETVFDVNMLIIDPKNVIVFNYNKQVFDALERYGITAHIVPFRHRYFWDGGIHCITADLHREGTMQDYFPDRS